uniref:Uncharacterized protein n=1 Tax=Cannabis sativa TaxID=3483 RepID=A0A803P4D6_CANSA
MVKKSYSKRPIQCHHKFDRFRLFLRSAFSLPSCAPDLADLGGSIPLKANLEASSTHQSHFEYTSRSRPNHPVESTFIRPPSRIVDSCIEINKSLLPNRDGTLTLGPNIPSKYLQVSHLAFITIICSDIYVPNTLKLVSTSRFCHPEYTPLSVFQSAVFLSVTIHRTLQWSLLVEFGCDGDRRRVLLQQPWTYLNQAILMDIPNSLDVLNGDSLLKILEWVMPSVQHPFPQAMRRVSESGFFLSRPSP